MPTPFEISDALTETWADADPISATHLGIAGREHLCTDYSPAAHAERTELYRATRSRLAPFCADRDRIQSFAARVLTGWLDEQIEDYEAGEWRRDLNHTESPFQDMRDVFDVMDRDSAESWKDISSRLRGFGGMLSGYRESLEQGIVAGDTVAVRQAESLLQQVRAVASSRSRFLPLGGEAAKVGADADEVDAAVAALRSACSEFADWLRERYLPAARPSDAVGRERYLIGTDRFLGLEIDPEETYEWGWSEVHRIRHEMEMVSDEIHPDKSAREIIHLLDSDPDRAAATREEFVDFVSGIQQQAISQLAGVHFDLPDELREVTVNIAPPDGSLGAWYMSPSEDFSRPGSIWYAPGERDSIPYWQEVTTAYHEGFPGHHLQVGTAVMEREKLSRFHRSVIWYAGSGEGWALYAERLMDELGFFEKPEYRFGLLASQLFRSIRVVVDIGCQLELPIPSSAPLHGGEIWGYEHAVDYVEEVGLQARDVAESEVKRYLGWVGQAISYKVGEREILAMREQARDTEPFELREFHRRMLEAGAIRLDHLTEVMT